MTKKLLLLFLLFILLIPLSFSARLPFRGETNWDVAFEKLWNISHTGNGTLIQGLNASFFDFNISNNLVVLGNINATIVNATQLLIGGKPAQASDDFNLGNISNYTQYIRNTDFNLGNISNYSQFIQSKDFNLGNISNNTLLRGDNSSISLWNISGSNIFPRVITGNVGIGTAAPTAKLDIALPSGTVDMVHYSGTQAANTVGHYNVFYGGTAGTTARGYFGYAKTGGGAATVFTNEIADYMGLKGVSGLHLGSNQDTPEITITGGNVGIGTTTPGSVLSVIGNFSTTTGALLATSSGNVGIGTTSPIRKLDVAGDIAIYGNLNATIINTSQVVSPVVVGGINIDSGIEIRMTSGISNGIGNMTFSTGTNGNNVMARFYNRDAKNRLITFDTDLEFGDGLLPIGGGDVSGAIQATIASSTATTNTNIGYQLALIETGNEGADKGGGIAFQGAYDNSNDVATFGAIRGRKDNSNLNEYGGYLSFLTRTHGVNAAERMRITSAGDVGINDTTPSYALDVDGQIRGNFTSSDGSKGLTASCASTTTLTVKNGLITACS